MPITELHLRNVCQHREFRRDLHAGLTLIVGRNGTGKSVLLNSMRACVTGDWSAFAGVKTENVSEHAAAGEPAYARVKYLHRGDELVITRGLAGVGDEVVVNGGRPQTGVRRVNEIVAEVLDLPLDVISRYVFVGQCRMAGFMSDTPAARADSLQVLFGTAHVGRVHDLLGGELEKAASASPLEELASLEHLLADLRGRSEAHAAALAALPAADASAVAAAIGLVAEVEARKDAGRRVIHARRRRRAEAAAVRTLALRRDEAAADEALFREACEVGRETVQEAKDLLRQWQLRRSQLSARSRREAQVVELRRRLAALVAPVEPPADTVALAAADADAGRSVRAEADVLQKMIASHTRTGCVVCPTCGAELASEERLADARARLPGLQSLAARYAAATRDVQAYQRAMAGHQATESSTRAQLQEADADVAAFEVVAEPGYPEEHLAGLIAEQAVFADNLKAAAARAADLRVRCAAAEGALAQMDRQIAELKSRLAAPRPGRADYAAARFAADEGRSALSRRVAVEAAKEEVDRQLAAAEARMEGVERRVRESAAELAWRGRVERMRPFFHRDGLARRVSQSRLAEIQDDVNEMLTAFKSRFTVEATDDLSFVANYVDGRRQRAVRLSPGEKVVLALAFRVAVNSIFAREIGMLAMDEPTDSLDSENIACVETAMERLRAVSQSEGLQCLVVTHERRLAKYCDEVIDLGGW